MGSQVMDINLPCCHPSVAATQCCANLAQQPTSHSRSTQHAAAPCTKSELRAHQLEPLLLLLLQGHCCKSAPPGWV